MARCNLTNDEREKVQKSRLWGMRDAEETAELRSYFPQYLIVERDEDGLEWHCSACERAGFSEKREERELYKAKHNSLTRCPDCGAVVTVKHRGRIKSGAKLHESTAVSLVHVDEDGAVLIESGVCFWDYDLDWGMEELFAAKRRYYFAPGKVQGWKRSLNWDLWSQNYHPSGWEAMASITEPFQENPVYGFDGFGYFIGMDKLRHSALKYSAMDSYFLEYHNMDIWERVPLRLVCSYLGEYAMRPTIEMAVKSGLCEFVGQLVRDGKAGGGRVNWKAQKPWELLKITKQEFKALNEGRDLGPQMLELHKRLMKSGGVKNAQQTMQIVSGIGSARLTDRVLHECDNLQLEPMRVAAYLSKRQGETAEWLDYLTMARKLDYDLKDITVALPKNLRERHDAAAEAIRYEADQKVLERYKARRAQLEEKYSYRMDGLRIVVPASAQDIIRDGQTLHHCVAGYADRHIRGEVTILFLRRDRKPNTPYMTIELDKFGNIKQIHGYKNERYPHAVDPKKALGGWLETWQNTYKKGKVMTA